MGVVTTEHGILTPPIDLSCLKYRWGLAAHTSGISPERCASYDVKVERNRPQFEKR